MIIYLPEPNEIHADALTLLRKHGHTLVDSLTPTVAAQVEALFVRTYTQLDKSYLSQFPALRTILRAGVGLDHIDQAECQRRGIVIFNAPGANARSVAEHALMSMLMLLKHVPTQTARLRQGLWRSRSQIGTELSGLTVGLIGCGAVGTQLADLLSPFEINLVGYDRFVTPSILAKHHISPSALPDLLTRSNVITLQVPLTPDTTGLLSSPEFARCQRGSYLVSVSRGELIDEPALIKSLTQGNLAGAALDSATGEPHVNPRLLSLDNLILTPHLAGFTAQADRRIAMTPALNFIHSLGHSL